MATKVRKQIYLERSQEQFVKREAKARGMSEAEFIRNAINAAKPTMPRGGDRPEAIEEVLKFARRRLAAARKRSARRTKVDGAGRGWTREDLYEERLARYGRRMPD